MSAEEWFRTLLTVIVGYLLGFFACYYGRKNG